MAVRTINLIYSKLLVLFWVILVSFKLVYIKKSNDYPKKLFHFDKQFFIELEVLIKGGHIIWKFCSI